jgi:hypothetical protein
MSNHIPKPPSLKQSAVESEATLPQKRLTAKFKAAPTPTPPPARVVEIVEMGSISVNDGMIMCGNGILFTSPSKSKRGLDPWIYSVTDEAISSTYMVGTAGEFDRYTGKIIKNGFEGQVNLALDMSGSAAAFTGVVAFDRVDDKIAQKFTGTVICRGKEIEIAGMSREALNTKFREKRVKINPAEPEVKEYAPDRRPAHKDGEYYREILVDGGVDLDSLRSSRSSSSSSQSSQPDPLDSLPSTRPSTPKSPLFPPIPPKGRAR